MENRKPKDQNQQKPIENHDTAAWANIETQQDVSKVNIPNEIQVRNAKEYVDSNQK